jgi:hypothetical protein
MNLRPNYFGLFTNSGLSVFIAAILFHHSFKFLGAIFIGIAVFHVMRLRRVCIYPDQIVVQYPFAPFFPDKVIPKETLITFRFVSGYYTDWNAVILRFKSEEKPTSIRIPVSPFDREELAKYLTTWYTAASLSR